MINLFKPKKAIVLDMGSHTIKLAEFSMRKKKPVLENCAFFNVPDNAIEQGDLVNSLPLEGVISEFIKQYSKNVSSLYISVSGRSIIVKKIDILYGGDDQKLINDLIVEEAKQILPFKLEDVNYDYVPLNIKDASNNEKQSVLLIAAKKDVINDFNQLIENEGMKCKSVDMGAFSLVDSLDTILPDISQEKEATLILDIGKSGTLFIVLYQGEMIFSRYLMMGSDSYTMGLVKNMGIEYQEAESLKISWCSNGETPAEVDSLISENHLEFVEEIFIGYDYFKNQYPNIDISKIYLTGGGSKIKNLNQIISDKFGCSVNLLDPFNELETSDFLENSLDHIKSFVPTLLGTYLRGRK